MDACMFVCTCIHMCVWMHACLYALVYVCIQMHACACVCVVQGSLMHKERKPEGLTQKGKSHNKTLLKGKENCVPSHWRSGVGGENVSVYTGWSESFNLNTICLQCDSTVHEHWTRLRRKLLGGLIVHSQSTATATSTCSNSQWNTSTSSNHISKSDTQGWHTFQLLLLFYSSRTSTVQLRCLVGHCY